LQACAAKTAVELIPTLSGDYTSGTALYKYQWDLIHNPERIWFSWLEEESEGEIGTLCEDVIKYNIKTYQDGDEKLWTNIGGNKLQLITPNIYDGSRNTSDWYEYLTQFYDFYQYKCSAGETFEQIAEKFDISVSYIKKYNANKQAINGSIIRIPPPEDVISELLTSRYINCFAYLHEIRCLNNNALYILEKMIRINQELLILNEIKEYSMLVAGVDLTISFIPIAGPVKAVVEIVMGKNVVHYVMFEKMKGIPVNDFNYIDYAQNAIDVLIPGVKVLNSTTNFIRLSNSTIEILEITGNVNGLINVGRTNYQQYKSIQ
jgi:hypothetical protein